MAVHFQLKTKFSNSSNFILTLKFPFKKSKRQIPIQLLIASSGVPSPWKKAKISFILLSIGVPYNHHKNFHDHIRQAVPVAY